MKFATRRAGIRDVARMAACSAASVSKVLNHARGRTAVGFKLADRIRNAAAKLGYVPDSQAQSLRTRRATGIGFALLVSENYRWVTGGFHSTLVSGVEMAARKRDQTLTLITESPGPGAGARAARTIARRQVSALVVSPNADRAFHKAVAAIRAPVVWAAPLGPRPGVSVVLNPVPGMDAAARHLMELGHRRVLVAGCFPKYAKRVSDRAKLIHARFTALGLDTEMLDFAPGAPEPPDSLRTWWLRTVRRVLGPRLGRRGFPTAIVGATEMIAIGAYHALCDAGLNVPRDVSVVSFDDIRPDMVDPPLTSISQELAAIGARAAEIAMDLAAGARRIKRGQRTVERVPAALIVRGSTGPVRAGA